MVAAISAARQIVYYKNRDKLRTECMVVRNYNEDRLG